MQPTISQSLMHTFARNSCDQCNKAFSACLHIYTLAYSYGHENHINVNNVTKHSHIIYKYVLVVLKSKPIKSG